MLMLLATVLQWAVKILVQLFIQFDIQKKLVYFSYLRVANEHVEKSAKSPIYVPTYTEKCMFE